MPSAEHSATIVAHADWSVDSRKRWVAVARREQDACIMLPTIPAPSAAPVTRNQSRLECEKLQHMLDLNEMAFVLNPTNHTSIRATTLQRLILI